MNNFSDLNYINNLFINYYEQKCIVLLKLNILLIFNSYNPILLLFRS